MASETKDTGNIPVSLWNSPSGYATELVGSLDLILDLKRTEQNCADKSKRRAGRKYIHPQS